MPTGSIHVQVTTGGVLPVAGVLVSITDAYEGAAAQLVSDENGDCPVVEVAAPEVSLSLSPQTAQLPYAVYTVTAAVGGYSPVVISGVQVFSGQVSLVPINLEPEENTGYGLEPAPQVYDIPLHHLMDPNAPHGSTAPVDNCTDERVLTQVVIPQYITVHLGRPAASAQNVTVTFKDYIKNVASSEIYPTCEG